MESPPRPQKTIKMPKLKRKRIEHPRMRRVTVMNALGGGLNSIWAVFPILSLPRNVRKSLKVSEKKCMEMETTMGQEMEEEEETNQGEVGKKQ